MKNIRIKHPRATTLFIVFILLSGCYSSREVTQFSALEKASSNGATIRVLTSDSAYYTFDTFSYSDSTLYGNGSREHRGVTENFEGILHFSNIVFIERLKFNGWKGFWLVPAALAIGSGVKALMQPPNFTIQEGSSCPFIYAFNGSKFILEAEAFSTSISKVLESQTYHLLSSLAPDDGEVTLRISNERPETHVFNSVRLFAVDAKESSSIVLDIDNNALAVHNAMPPREARDQAGIDILEALAGKDNNFWKSDMKAISSDSGFRDELVVQFEQPKGKSEATLIVNAINSELITEVYRAAGALIGDDALRFYQTLEQDQELKNYFLEWIERSSLLVEVKDGNNWREAGRIRPEANEVSFTRAIRLKNLDNNHNIFTVRLSSMTDVWHIDAISADYSDGSPLPMKPLELTSVYTSNDIPHVEEAIRESDSSYAMILPPDYMELTFDATPAKQMQNPAYVVAAQGYLYEWFPESEMLSSSVIPDWFTGMDRSKMLPLFTRQEGLFLRAIYAGWEQRRKE